MWNAWLVPQAANHHEAMQICTLAKVHGLIKVNQMKFFVLQLLLVLVLPAGCARHRAKLVSTEAIATQTTVQKSAYDNPLSTPGARFGSLPAVVQNTVRSEAGTAEIIDARREISDGRLYYKISFRDPKTFPPLLVGPDGSVLHSDLSVAVPAPQEVGQSIKPSDLPVTVKKVVDEKQPGAEIVSVNLENWGTHAIYIISFKDDKPKLYIATDGTVLIPVK